MVRGFEWVRMVRMEWGGWYVRKGHTIATKKRWDQKLIQFPEKIEGPIYSYSSTAG